MAKRKFSAAHRAKLTAAQKRRWAKKRKPSKDMWVAEVKYTVPQTPGAVEVLPTLEQPTVRVTTKGTMVEVIHNSLTVTVGDVTIKV